MIIRMAFRNVWRHKIRSSLTMFAIFLGIVMSVFGMSVNNGMQKSVINMFIQTDIGSLKIYPGGYYDNREEKDPLDYEFENSEKLKINILSNLDSVKISRRLVFNGNITDGMDDIPVTMVGIVPGEEKDTFGRDTTVIKGEYFNKENSSESILISAENAELFNAGVGDYLTLMTRDKFNSMNAYDAEIVGIFRTGNPQIDNTAIFMSDSFARQFTGKEEFNEMVLMLDISSRKNTEQSYEILKKNIDEKVGIVPWYEEISDFLKTMEIDEKSGQIFMGIIFLMAAFGIANTLIMAVYERKREIGILYALGFDRKRLISLFTLEGTLIGIIGGIFAALIGGTLVYYFAVNGLSIPTGQETLESIPMGDRIYTYIAVPKFCAYVFAGIFVATIASLYPAWFATRLNPVEIMRD